MPPQPRMARTYFYFFSLAETGLSMVADGNKEKGLSKPFTEDWQRRLRL